MGQLPVNCIDQFIMCQAFFLLGVLVGLAQAGHPVCKTIWENKCWDEPRKQCSTVSVPYTITEYEQKCSSIQVPKVESVPKEKCVDVPEEKCSTTTEKKCSTKYEQECSTNKYQCPRLTTRMSRSVTLSTINSARKCPDRIASTSLITKTSPRLLFLNFMFFIKYIYF